MKKLLTIIGVLILAGAGCSSPSVPEAKQEILGVLDTSRTIEQWNGEAKLTIGYPLVGGEVVLGASEGAELNEVLYDSPEKSVKTYDIPPNDTYKNGAIEFEVIFKKKPATNTVEFDIDGHGLEFHYQSPLNEEEGLEEGLTCSATECFNEDNVRVYYRPENIVDSYAVYSKNKMNHKTGDTNYRIGKAFHIYRSKIIDAEGEWTWAESMNYVNGVLTVTIPQSFLDTAAYPVTVDPNLGYDTAGGSQSTNATDQIMIFELDAGEGYRMTEAGTAASMWLYTGGDGAADDTKAAIYDNNGTPNAFVDESTGSPTYNESTTEWHEWTGFDASLSDATIYHPAIWNDHAWNAILVFYDSVGDGDDGRYVDPQTFGAWPDPIDEDGGGGTSLHFSAYIEYTTGAPPEVAAVPIIADIIIF